MQAHGALGVREGTTERSTLDQESLKVRADLPHENLQFQALPVAGAQCVLSSVGQKDCTHTSNPQRLPLVAVSLPMYKHDCIVASPCTYMYMHMHVLCMYAYPCLPVCVGVPG